jgi:hypothetical protein
MKNGGTSVRPMAGQNRSLLDLEYPDKIDIAVIKSSNLFRRFHRCKQDKNVQHSSRIDALPSPVVSRQVEIRIFLLSFLCPNPLLLVNMMPTAYLS